MESGPMRTEIVAGQARQSEGLIAVTLRTSEVLDLCMTY